MPRIAYFGPQGTFTEQAARALADPREHELLPLDTIPAVVAAVRSGEVAAGCVPVENSVEGAVPATMDALALGEPVVAVAEHVLPVHFSVLVRPGTEAAQIQTVASHPHGLAQVRGWLEANLPKATAIAVNSTAGAARAVHAGEYDAAVSAPVAVEHYPLHELATGVADVADAVTRFLLVTRPGALPAPTGADRTSLVAVAVNRTGALSGLLHELALREINLTRLEARPTKDRFGEYRFFLDVEGHLAEQRIADALAALHRRCLEVRFLGSYPRTDGTQTQVAAPTRDEDFAAATDWVAAVRRGERA
ncbi:prephenate dehydratase [Kutzneria viridogrisea]|uniref:Prephenate dehydratase n=2 Tax=Kutzneria TaxID=43356 RepID=W5VYI8_9PSEU|nr:prephenate dehydratase [Kutzneria albida]AHH93510.1 Prephenate dehydratase [Kutzneria albida DSM 43870]MBA8929104.1 prephenate dehydratase [Kutzneria viridogrisea]